MKPLVTIGIPCFNAERWLGTAVESALAQTWPEKEIIVIDDGSSDGSVEIARGFGERVRLLETEHRGANHARNAILREAKGAWIQYLDADDYLLPDKISTQLDGAPPEAEVLYSPILQEFMSAGERSLLPIDVRDDAVAQWFSWQMPQTGGCLWLRETLQKLGGWSEQMPCCQEHELYARALRAGVRFDFRPKPGAVYRIWSDDTLCRRNPRMTIETKTELMDQMYRWAEESGTLTQRQREAAAQGYFEMARSLAKVDLLFASEYHAARKRRGLIRLGGLAAPFSYRLVYFFAGFANAERLACFLRAKAS